MPPLAPWRCGRPSAARARRWRLRMTAVNAYPEAGERRVPVGGELRRRRPPIGPLEYCRRWWLQLIVATTFILLYAPIVTLVAFSFNDSRRNIVWRGFTFDY